VCVTKHAGCCCCWRHDVTSLRCRQKTMDFAIFPDNFPAALALFSSIFLHDFRQLLFSPFFLSVTHRQAAHTHCYSAPNSHTRALALLFLLTFSFWQSDKYFRVSRVVAKNIFDERWFLRWLGRITVNFLAESCGFFEGFSSVFRAGSATLFSLFRWQNRKKWRCALQHVHSRSSFLLN